MSDVNSARDREVTLRFNVRNGLVWGTVLAGALWADLVVGLGLYGIYSLWQAHSVYDLTSSVTVTLGLSEPLFLLFFTVAVLWVALTFLGVRSQQDRQSWASHRLLAVAVNVVAGILLLLTAGLDPVFTGRLLTPALLLSVLLALDGVVAALGSIRFFHRSRV